MSDAAPRLAPRAIIIADPNGAGKTTFAREFLPAEGNCPTFINADLIAAGLSPFQPEKANVTAMRLMAERIRQCVAHREDFAVESTLAGRTYANLIRQWRQVGYVVKIVFLRLDSPEMAIARVQHRVRMGGHNVAEPVIRRRYQQGWSNFQNIYRSMVDHWQVYDAMKTSPVLMDEGGEAS
ncbi:MAG: zeta toxin family protein [Phycisphaeraceae bacterium]